MSAYFTQAELEAMKKSVPLPAKLFGRKWITMTPNFMVYGINWMGTTYVLGEAEPRHGWHTLPKGYNMTHLIHSEE